jgi:hypothetical protein
VVRHKFRRYDLLRPVLSAIERSWILKTPNKITRWYLASTYLTVLAVLPCAHNHPAGPSTFASSSLASEDGAWPRLIGSTPSVSHASETGCLACQFLSQHQAGLATDSLSIELPDSGGHHGPARPILGTGPIRELTCRGPPRA